MHARSTVLLQALLAFSLLAGTAASPVLARSPASIAAKNQGDPDILKRFEAAVPHLDLWPEQKPRIQKLVAGVKASLKKIEASTDAPEKKQQLLKAVHAKAQDGLNHILTVAQAEKLKKLMNGSPGGK
jgi:Spy/CpxP family protein refolding chaperone